MKAERASLRLTRRGLTLTGIGSLFTVAGVGLGVPTLVQAGLLPLLAVLAGVGSVTLPILAARGRTLTTNRTVRPHPASVGQPSTVDVTVHGKRQLDRMRLTEQASAELTDGTGPRARVRRMARGAQLSYPIRPGRRGRWTVGPLRAHLRDPFGTVQWSGALGAAVSVAVRPAIVELKDRGGAALLDAAAAGAHSPSPDDAALREYRSGDDPRRVHWRSTARRGELVVRQDEHSGHRPATVLLDLPPREDALEWTISAGASIAVALLGAGYRVRLLTGHVEATRYDPHDREKLLDEMIDLSGPADAVTGRARLLDDLTLLTSAVQGTELVVAVLGELDTRPIADLGRVAAVHTCRAIVRGTERGVDVGSGTLEGVLRSGWAACLAHRGETIDEIWQRLQAQVEATVPR
jgi:uncharacterized protein (DUF58 family)